MLREKALIYQASPALAGLKSASLFTVKLSCMEELVESLRYWNKSLSIKGVTLVLLRVTGSTALIYVYRKRLIEGELNSSKARHILARYGYKFGSVSSMVAQLKSRLAQSEEFPHEIGLFLGYPPSDVEGFICNGGDNCLLCGYWKVYGNQEEAIKKFAQYDKCKQIYKKLWEEGRSIYKLVVA